MCEVETRALTISDSLQNRKCIVTVPMSRPLEVHGIAQYSRGEIRVVLPGLV